MTPPRRSTSNLRCPRCGYDLRGVVEAWTVSCPLEGTCSECGLRWEWADLLSPVRRAVWWNIEVSERPWALRTFFRTLFKQLSPWIAWRELQMAHAVRVTRLVGYIGFLIILCLLSVYGAHIGRSVGTYINWKQNQSGGVVYSSPAEVLWLRLTFTPFSEGSLGKATVGGRTLNMAAPRDYIETLFLHTTLGFDDNWFSAEWQWGLIAPLIVIVCWMFALVGTPNWLRHERLRRAHYLRIGVYALSFLLFGRLATMITFWLAGLGVIGTPMAGTMQTAHSVALVLMFLLAGPWWIHVCDDYLRLRQPRRVAIVVHLFGFVFPLGVIGALNTVDAVRSWLQ